MGVAIAGLDASADAPSLATLGFYYVHPDHRGNGLGSQLFNSLFTKEEYAGHNWAINAGKCRYSIVAFSNMCCYMLHPMLSFSEHDECEV